jgi:hypothetical protein
MPDIEFDFEELNLNIDLKETDEKDKKPLDFDEDSKISFTDYYRLLPNLDILINIRYFRLFCSLLACS